MTVHAPHLELLYGGLHDDCERCAEQADDPGQLDRANRERLRLGHLYSDLDRRAAENLAHLDRRDFGIV